MGASNVRVECPRIFRLGGSSQKRVRLRCYLGAAAAG
jgi:hypothetical protein